MASSFHRSANTIPAPLPDDYVRQANFTQYEVNHPGQAPRGTDLDSEFNKVGYALAETQDRLSLIQRPDGNLVNGIVLPESLSTAAKTITTGVWNPRGPWASGTAYAKRDLVVANGVSYVCTTDNVASANFSTDQAAGYWIPVSVAASLVSAAQNYANQAGSSAQTASNSATQAAQSATTATTRANTAATSATTAANSAAAASTSASAAAGSQAAAANSATSAANSASNASNAASNASTYANNASASAANAASEAQRVTSGYLDTRYVLSGGDGSGNNLVHYTASANVPVSDSGKTFTTNGAITLTLSTTPSPGTNYTIYGNGNGQATISSGVNSGTPGFGFPDGTFIFSYAIPTDYESGIFVIFDGNNWRANTFGNVIVHDAVNPNEATSLRQLNNHHPIYESSPFPINANTIASASHGFGQSPTHAWAVLRCVTAEWSYWPGNEANFMYYDGTGGGNGPPPVKTSSSIIQMPFGDVVPLVVKQYASTGADWVNITRGNWRLVLRAMK